jgi:hypothetical protein
LNNQFREATPKIRKALQTKGFRGLENEIKNKKHG